MTYPNLGRIACQLAAGIKLDDSGTIFSEKKILADYLGAEKHSTAKHLMQSVH